MAGHLFGYEAALAIDAQARPLREARAAIEDAVGDSVATDGDDAARARCARRSTQPPSQLLRRAARRRLRRPPRGQHRGAAGVARSATRSGVAPLDAYQVEHGRVGTPAVVVDDLTAALTQGIEELTRPVDAIKHQAKTVTVGISRTDETLLQPCRSCRPCSPPAPPATGSPTGRCARWPTSTPRSPRSPAGSATSSTATPDDGEAPVAVVDRGGIALDIPSRTERAARAAGHEAPRRPRARRCSSPGAASDGRTIVIVPEIKDDQATGITLLHVRFHDRLLGRRRPAACCRATATATPRCATP